MRRILYRTPKKSITIQNGEKAGTNNKGERQLDLYFANPGKVAIKYDFQGYWNLEQATKN